MKRIRSTNDRLVDVIVFNPKKNKKLQPVTPLMLLEALLIQVNLTDSDSDGINGGTGCNFLFLLCRLLVVGPVLKWLALFITVPTTCSRPSIEMVGFITVPTTCSRPSIEMIGFMYVCMYVFIYVFLRVHSPDQTVIYY